MKFELWIINWIWTFKKEKEIFLRLQDVSIVISLQELRRAMRDKNRTENLSAEYSEKKGLININSIYYHLTAILKHTLVSTS